MSAFTPHRTVLELHRLVDPAIYPLIAPMQLDLATEQVIRVGDTDLQALSAAGNPQAALISLGSDATPAGSSSALMIMEPGTSAAVIERIFSSQSRSASELTQLEVGIVQQFMNDMVGHWHTAWADADIELLPTLTMVAPLSRLTSHINPGTWYIARTIILDANEEIGVVLFCYPLAIIDHLVEQRANTSWRHRIDRGLTDDETQKLRERARELHNVIVPIPVTHRVDVPLRALNELERGDIISLDAMAGGDMHCRLLDRDVTGRLGQSGTNLAFSITAGASATSFDSFGAGDDFAHNPEMDPFADPYADPTNDTTEQVPQ